MRKRNILIGGFIVIIFAGLMGAWVVYDTFFNNETVELSTLNTGIAFASNRDGAWHIYVLDTDGTLLNVTPQEGGYDYFPSWAFDGEMLNFLSSRQGDAMGPGQVMVDGSEFAVLDIVGAIMSVAQSQRFDWDPTWSANGQQAWSKIANLNLDLYLIDDETGEEVRLTSDAPAGARDWFISWSPDGRHIVYSTDRNNAKEDVYLIDTQSADLTPIRLTTDETIDDFHPAWTLAGDAVVYVADYDDGMMDGVVQLYMMDQDGQNQRPVGETVVAWDPIYSADGSQMIYVSNESGTWSLYLMDVASGHVQQLTDDAGDDLFPVWRPVPVDTTE